MNVVLFGGSFNPPHFGHSIVIQQAFELIPKIDELWILPCYRHTFQKNLAPVTHRFKMSQLLVNEANAFSPRVKLSTIEIDHKLSGETYDALQLLKESYSNHTFSFLMGTDQLKGFKKWGNWEKLIEEMPFYIYPRAGYRNKITFSNMSLLESPTQVITNISSTLIRERIRKRQQIAHLVPPSVLKYLRIHRVY